MKESAFLYGPCVGELYWEAGRFAPISIWQRLHSKPKYKRSKIIVFTREERFDLYGNHADILVPLRIEGDYDTLKPNCFRLNGLEQKMYESLVSNFKAKYEKRYQIINHIYPNIAKGQFANKNQFRHHRLDYSFSPRQANYDLVDKYLIDNVKPLVVLGSRFRKGFRRNWPNWKEFYDLIYKDQFLMDNFSFILCGKNGEYVCDESKRFYDMNCIDLVPGSSLVGLLLVILERSFFTFGSQSAIPNLSLLYGVDVLEFGCQKALHTKTYNVKKTPITFIDNRKYDLGAGVAKKQLRKLLANKLKGETK